MSLIFKYWVEFDDEGDIKALHKSKYNCDSKCKEYLVKLLPIKRDKTEELTKNLDKLSNEVDQNVGKLNTNIKKFNTELDKTVRSMKRIKLK